MFQRQPCIRYFWVDFVVLFNNFFFLFFCENFYLSYPSLQHWLNQWSEFKVGLSVHPNQEVHDLLVCMAMPSVCKKHISLLTAIQYWETLYNTCMLS